MITLSMENLQKIALIFLIDSTWRHTWETASIQEDVFRIWNAGTSDIRYIRSNISWQMASEKGERLPSDLLT